MTAHVAGHGALGDYFATLLERRRSRWATRRRSPGCCAARPRIRSQPSWGGRFVRAWDRPFAVFERLTTAADRIEHFAILELVLPLGDGAPAHPEASLVVENQSLVGARRRARRVPLPLLAEGSRRPTPTRSAATRPSLDGRTGAITAIDPAPDAAAQRRAGLPHWWTDDPAPAAAEGVHHGAGTVSQWRRDFLADFAARLERARTPAAHAMTAGACRGPPLRLRRRANGAPAAACGDQLEGSQARVEVVDVRHDDQLVGPRPLEQARRGRAAPSRRCRRRCTPASAAHGTSRAAASRRRCRRSAAAIKPRAPRRMSVNDICCEVASRRASASVPAAMTLTPTIAWGAASCGRRLEASAVDRQRRVELLRREVRRERERQPELRGELGAEQARSEDVDRHLGAGPGHGLDALSGSTGARKACSSSTSCGKCSASPAGGAAPPASLIGAGRAAEPEIDPSGKAASPACRTVRR